MQCCILYVLNVVCSFHVLDIVGLLSALAITPDIKLYIFSLYCAIDDNLSLLQAIEVKMLSSSRLLNP